MMIRYTTIVAVLVIVWVASTLAYRALAIGLFLVR